MRVQHYVSAGCLLCMADTWHDDSYFGSSGLIITSRIRSSLRTDNHSHVIIPLFAHHLYALSEERDIGVNLMHHQLQQSQLWERRIFKMMQTVFHLSISGTVMNVDLRVFGCLIVFRQQLSNAMVNYTMDTKCLHSLLSICQAFVNISAQRSKGKSTV